MTLHYRTRKTVRADLSMCERCLLEADKFLSKSVYVDRIERVGEGVYHVRFKWRKWGMTRYYDVTFRVRRENGKVVYESVEGSRYPMRFEFRLESRDGESALEAEARMDAGLMADLLGKKDFARFIDDLVETGFVSLVQESLERQGRGEEAREAMAGARAPGVGVSCEACILFDPERKYCYYLRKSVGDPSRPPCGGRAFVPHTLRAARTG